MQFNTFVSSIYDLERCLNAPNLHEVLLEPTLLARQGKLSEKRVQTLATEARERGLRPVLVWDILMPERLMINVCERLKNWEFNCFAAIRVCDPGVAYWVKTHFPEIPIQLIVETGNHNLESLKGWCEIFSGSLERLILSIELPEEKLIEYCQKLPVACELLGVGQILLFYSPRSLLAKHLLESQEAEVNEATNYRRDNLTSPPTPLLQGEGSLTPPFPLTKASPLPPLLVGGGRGRWEGGLGGLGVSGLRLVAVNEENSDSLYGFNPESPLYLEASAAFEDAPNRHFPTLETAHGTFMFLDKDQFILDKLDGLRSAGLHTVRLDLRHLGKEGDVAVEVDRICRQILENPAELRTNWPRETRAPFFKANRTTAIFPRMKSKVSDYRDDSCLAEVIAGESKKYVVFYTLRPFEISQIENMMMPTGEKIEIPQGVAFRNLNGEELDTFESEQILVTDWIKKAVPGSLLLGKNYPNFP